MGWLPTLAVAGGGVGLKVLSGYRGVTFANALTDKELRVLAVSGYRQIRHRFRADLLNIQYLLVLI